MKLLKFISLALTTMLFVGCVNMMEISDPKMIDTYLTKNYPYSVEKCFLATKKALRNLDTQIEEIDENKKITTQRTVIFRTITGNYNARVNQQYHKYYLDFKGSDSTCTVRAYKYRYWFDNDELEEINVQYAQPKIWEPFFKAIENELKDLK